MLFYKNFPKQNEIIIRQVTLQQKQSNTEKNTEQTTMGYEHK